MNKWIIFYCFFNSIVFCQPKDETITTLEHHNFGNILWSWIKDSIKDSNIITLQDSFPSRPYIKGNYKTVE